jgi:hypothetical protein
MKTKTLQLYTKDFGLKAAQGVEVTGEILAKINKYALRELTPEEIFVRRFLMAHNAVDRDNERFPEPILDDFARTLPGKSLLNGHDRYTLPLGLYFDAFTEELTPEQFTALTGEEARLPEGVTMVKVLWGWVYMLKANFNASTTANIDAGIYRHASIGFKASDIMPITGSYSNILYYEYVPPGEALEGSIVWLGAQPGATTQKQVAHSQISDFEPAKEKENFVDWRKKNPLTPLTQAEKIENHKRERREACHRNPLTPLTQAEKIENHKRERREACHRNPLTPLTQAEKIENHKREHREACRRNSLTPPIEEL